MKFKDRLESLGACYEAVEWVGRKGPKTAWDKLAQNTDVDLRVLTRAKVECAKLVKHLMKDERSLKALEVAERFANGEATREELAVADYDAAVAAYDADYAAHDAYVAASSNSSIKGEE